MDVVLRYFGSCPSWQTADEHVRAALVATGHADVLVRHEKVETPEDAERLAFVGSPTVLVDGVDPFRSPDSVVGLACRLYTTPQGLRGSPTREQLEEVFR